MKNQNENNNKSAEKTKEKPNADNFREHAMSLVERMNKIPTIEANLKNVLFGAFAEIKIMYGDNNERTLLDELRMAYDESDKVVINQMTRNLRGVYLEEAVLDRTFAKGVIGPRNLYDILKELKSGMGHFRAYAIKNMRLHSMGRDIEKKGWPIVIDFRISEPGALAFMPRMDLVVERMRKPDFVSSYKCRFDIDTAEGFYQFRLYVNIKKEGGEQ